MAVKTFVTGEVLTASDTNTYLANSGLVYVAGGSFTGASNFEVTGFTSTYVYYDIELSGIRTTAGTAILRACLYNNTTARNSAYYGATVYASYTGTTGAESADNNAVDFFAGILDGTYRGNTSMKIRYKSGEQMTCNLTGFDATSFRGFSGGTFRNGTDAWDRIRFTPAAGLVTGEWRLYGRREP